MRKIIKELKNTLLEAVERTHYKGLLFSGGLDTSILAYLNPKVVAITVSLGSEAKDIKYSKSVARHLKLEHFLRIVEIDEAIESIPKVIKILKSFDLALPNDLVIYFGLKFAKRIALNSIATGDGSDELFAGYSFMKDIEDLEGYIRKISRQMSFSANKIGDFFGLKIIQPYLDKELIDFSLKIPVDLKIRKDKEGVSKPKIFGKWILRKAFEDFLPREIIWQEKRALEFGSNMNRIRQIISEKVSDKEFRQNSFGIKFINKEHLYYYKIYREVVGEIPKPKKNQNSCLGCRAGIEKNRFHCKICGKPYYHRVGD